MAVNDDVFSVVPEPSDTALWTNIPVIGIVPPPDPKPWQANPSSPWLLVNSKFDTSMAMATDMLERLVGSSGDGGYLGTLNSLINSFDFTVDFPDLTFDISDINIISDTRPPVPSVEINTDFPTFTEPVPVVISLPTIDLSDIVYPNLPEEVNPSLDWNSIPFNSDIYVTLLNRVLTDLTNGSTGLDPIVEQEIWGRALDRQAVENEKIYTEIETYFASRGYNMPPGAMAGRLQEAGADILRNNTDLNSKIMIEQAELAQKNSQFIITQALAIEGMLRDFHSKNEDRSLDYAKTLVESIIRMYSEKIKAYIATNEANISRIQIQVENLRGVVEYNKGLIDVYKSTIEAFGIKVDSIAKQNSSIVEIYKADIIGYDAYTRTLTSDQMTQIEIQKSRIMKADLELREAIARVEASLQGYTSESNLREKISNDMAQIAAQSVASALNAVNASASLGYSGSEATQESWSHSESINEQHSISGSISESHSYEEEPTT